MCVLCVSLVLVLLLNRYQVYFEVLFIALCYEYIIVYMECIPRVRKLIIIWLYFKFAGQFL